MGEETGQQIQGPDRMKYNNFERLEMGLFFQELEKDYKLSGTKHWEEGRWECKAPQVRGEFFERTPNGRIASIEFESDEERIYFRKNGRVQWLELCLTGLEERFSFMDGQRVYEIKLNRKNLITTLYTTNLATFTAFYMHLSKFCVLLHFEKHFRLTNQLGSGAFSKVYNGQNIYSREEVALKVFDKKKISQIEDGFAIIVNEIVNLEKLRKYKLSPLIETYETEDCIIIVMQKAEAGNMLDYLHEHQSDYNDELVRYIMLRVLENLDELHSAGFIHRDLKPENILFKSHSSQSSLFFGDFGLTVEKNQSSTTRIGRICSGTVGFVAPEVFNDNSYDEKCDLFSLGCLFYFLHKGQSLFHDKNIEQIFEMTRDDRIIERKINALQNLTPESKQLMSLLLRISPQERPSTREALQHSYFGKLEHHKPATGEEDHTIEEYLHKRIDKFFKR